MYTSKICSDCQSAKSFFTGHNIEIDYKDIAQEKNKNELINKYGRLAVPTIIIDKKVILGFEDNKEEIMKLLKIIQ